MNDREFLFYAFKGDEHAVQFILDLTYVVGIWDDMIDRDKDIAPADVNTAFATAMIGMPRNPFFQRHANDLLPVMSIGVTNYLIANQYESGDIEARALAHVMRYSIVDVATHVATLIGGMAWAESVGPELRRRGQRDTLDNYLQEMEKKHACPA